jgi:AraC-like DNA-binding protein
VRFVSFSTGSLPPLQRLTRWNDVTGAATTPLAADPVDKANFRAQLRYAELSSLKLSEIHSAASTVSHSKEHVAIVREPEFLIALQLDGACKFSQTGTDALLKPGDFALFDNTLPFYVSTTGTHKLLVLAFSHATLEQHVTCPQALLGRRMRGDVGLSGLASHFIRGFWSGCQCRPDEFSLPHTVDAVLDVIAAVFAQSASETRVSSLAAVWRVRIRDYVEQHLHEPGLTPTQIAAALRISPRYLHHLFDGEDETVAKYLQGRRLEKCARELSDPSQSSRSVTEIALSYGFNNSSHFSRVFRTRYRTTPRDYRARRLAGILER